MQVIPLFRAERCVRYRYSYSECVRCESACPHEAISLTDAGVDLSQERCRGCGLCVSACPTEALSDQELTAEHLLKVAGGSLELTLACTPSGAQGDAMAPCLGALHPVVLAEMARRGIAVTLAGTTHCNACAHAEKGVDAIRVNQDAYNLLCAALPPESCAPLRFADEAASGADTGHDAARRGLFRRIAAKSMDVASGRDEAPPAPLKAIRAGAPFLPERKLTLNGLFAASGEAPLKVARHDMIPAEDWQVVAGCTYCEACVRVCPTGAMQLLENQGAWRLAILNDRCVACDVCAEVCQPGVLRAADADQVLVNKQKGRLLAAVAKRRCSRCDRVFVDDRGSAICPICSGDDDDFASIFG